MANTRKPHAVDTSAVAQTSAPSARKRKAVPVGPAAETLGQRLRTAMAKHSPVMTESDLLNACRDWKAADGRPLVSQQLVNQILGGKNSRSAYVPLLAEALGVRAVWLQFGIGPMKSVAPNGRGAMSFKDHADKAFMEAFRELPKEWEFMVRSIVETLAVANRDSHGAFAAKARAMTQAMMEGRHMKVHDE